MSVFTLQDGTVYQTYTATARGVEFLMGYYPILDRVPRGRDEGDGSRPGFAATTSTSAGDKRVNRTLVRGQPVAASPLACSTTALLRFASQAWTTGGVAKGGRAARPVVLRWRSAWA